MTSSTRTRPALPRCGTRSNRGTRILEPAGRRTLDSAVDRPLARRVPFRDEIAEVDSALGCCTLFPRAVAERIGGGGPPLTPAGGGGGEIGAARGRPGGN